MNKKYVDSDDSIIKYKCYNSIKTFIEDKNIPITNKVILIKISSNSGKNYPYTTNPILLEQTIRILKEKGAKSIIVGESSGNEYVHKPVDGTTSYDWRKYTSTVNLLLKNGLYDKITGNAQLIEFEKYRFKKATFDFTTSWKAMYIPEVLADVDGIIYLSRISAHIISGFTSGLKNAVGFLDEYSRYHLHKDGENFIDKCADINYCKEIRSKFLFCASDTFAINTSIGPDWGHVVSNQQFGKVLVYDNLIEHDVNAFLELSYIQDSAVNTSENRLYPLLSNFMNFLLVNASSILIGKFKRLCIPSKIDKTKAKLGYRIIERAKEIQYFLDSTDILLNQG